MRKIKFDESSAIKVFQELAGKLENNKGLLIHEIIDICANNGFGRTTYFVKNIVKFLNKNFKDSFFRENRNYRCKHKALSSYGFSKLVEDYSRYLDETLVPKPKVEPKVESENWPSLGSSVYIMRSNKITTGKIVGLCYFDSTDQTCTSAIQYTIRYDGTPECCLALDGDFSKTIQDLLNNLIKQFKSSHE